MEDIVEIGEVPEGSGEYSVLVTWYGLEEAQLTWEKVKIIYEDAPKYLVRKLKI